MRHSLDTCLWLMALFIPLAQEYLRVSKGSRAVASLYLSASCRVEGPSLINSVFCVFVLCSGDGYCSRFFDSIWSLELRFILLFLSNYCTCDWSDEALWEEDLGARVVFTPRFRGGGGGSRGLLFIRLLS